MARRGSGWTARLLGAMALLAVAVPSVGAAVAAPMEFSILAAEGCKGATCPKVLLGEGEIERDTYRAFLRAAGKLKPGTTLILHSPGGEVSGAMMLGMAIRGAGFDTVVPDGAVCNSACAYAFLGGVSRAVLDGGAIGVHRSRHQLSNGDKLPPDIEREVDADVNAKLLKYVASMGVSTGMLRVADKIAANEIRYLTPQELRRFGVEKGHLHMFTNPDGVRQLPVVRAPDGARVETRVGS